MRTTEPRDSIFGLPLFPPQSDGRKEMNRVAQDLTNDVNQALQQFSPRPAAVKLTHESEDVWISRGQQRTLALFHAAAKYVPAYQDFLRRHKVNPDKIQSFQDFSQLPTVDKQNYLRAYPLEQLCWYGKLEASQMISVSSGSSGKPFFWPRGQILDMETTLEHELFLTTMFDVDKKSTLCVVCFAMGMYVAGPITMNSVVQMSRKGYPITVVTPGYSPQDVLTVIPDLAPKFDQVLLAGYPPYIKEIIDQGIEKNIDWEKIKLRFLLAGEGFNESWRSYVAELAGDQDPEKDFINLYGSADAAVLAYETPASIRIRRQVADNSSHRQVLFGKDRLPSLLQFLPEHKYFETVDNELVFTAPGGVPLVRYNIHDSGGVLNQSQIAGQVPETQSSLAQLRDEGRLWNLPFVYVFGKSDQTAILYGANVYPENIQRALEEQELRRLFTGKLIMYTAPDRQKDQRLHIEIECANGTKPTPHLTERTQRRILTTLLETNSEYRVVHRGIGKRTVPMIHLFAYQDERFQPVRVKHTWTRPEA